MCLNSVKIDLFNELESDGPNSEWNNLTLERLIEGT